MIEFANSTYWIDSHAIADIAFSGHEFLQLLWIFSFLCRHLHCDPGWLLISTFQERSLEAGNFHAPDLSHWSCWQENFNFKQRASKSMHWNNDAWFAESWCKQGEMGRDIRCQRRNNWKFIWLNFSRLVTAVPRNCHSIRQGRFQTHSPICDLWINVSFNKNSKTTSWKHFLN